MFKSLAVILSVVVQFMLSADTLAADSPRQRLSMDFGWKFMLGDPAGAQAEKLDESGWQAIDLPHDWSVAGSFDENAAAGGGGGYLPTGIGWYRKTFPLADSFKGKKIAVEFDGVYENSEVWINNHRLGKRPFGYIGFSYDLTPYLNFGGLDNVIAVRVDNSAQPNSRWYSGSGIYRHTWLTATDPLAIARWGTFITTPQVSRQNATIQAAVQVGNQRGASARFSLSCAVLDEEGREIQRGQMDGQLDAGAAGQFEQQLTFDHPNLWSVERPYLYTVRCTLLSGENVIDQCDTHIGIRSIEFDVDKGFLLNGEPVKLNGVCLHGDGGCVGAAVPEGVWLRRLRLLKEMGCNAIRTSHNPPAPEFLDLCDRLGFLVMDEAFDEWTAGKTLEGYHRFFGDWSQRDLVDFIHRDRNHPCVVLWSAGNEIQEQVLPGGALVLEPLVATFHREDPTRPVTAACDKLFAEPLSAPRNFPRFSTLSDTTTWIAGWTARITITASIAGNSPIANSSARRAFRWADPAAIIDRCFPMIPRRRRRRLCLQCPRLFAVFAGFRPATAGSTWNSFGNSSERTTTSRAISCGRGSITWARRFGRPGARRSACSTPAGSRRTAIISIKANGPANPSCIYSRTGTGKAAKGGLSRSRVIRTAIRWNCSSMANHSA